MPLFVDAAAAETFALEVLLRQRARKRQRDSLERLSLREYVSAAWPTVDPSAPFIPSWHVDAICEHLEAVTRGEIERLVINVPPGSAKSLLCSVFWPTWEWTFRPEGRWLANSYSSVLSLRDSLRSRRLIQSRWYQEKWGALYRLTDDQNRKGRYDNDRSGYRIASSVAGANTGERADRLVVDDPHNVAQAESALDRQGALVFFNEVLPSRGNDPRHTPVVLIQQRVHMEDCTGDALKKGGWHLLRVPMEYEATLSVDFSDAWQGEVGEVVDRAVDPCPLPTKDPRTEEGEYYDPVRYDETAVQKLKLTLGAYAYAGQYQQRPTPRKGSIIDPSWFRMLPTGMGGVRVQFWDTAFSGKQTADYTAAATVDMDSKDRMALTSVWHERVNEGGLDAVMADHIAATHPQVVFVEEAAFKQVAIRDLVDRVSAQLRLRGLAVPIRAVKVDRDKVTRAQIIGTYGRAGLLYADLGAGWWPACSAEMAAFPLGAHDDQVDAISGALAAAVQHVAGRRTLSVLLGSDGAPLRVGDGPTASEQSGKQSGGAMSETMRMLLDAR